MFILSGLRLTAFLHNQDPTPTLATAGIDADHSNRNVEALRLGVLLIFFAWPALIAGGQ
jgi:hypothetical protein